MVEQTELTLISSVADLIEEEVYYSDLHNDVWRLKIKEPDLRRVREDAIDYIFAVIKDDVKRRYVVYSNYRESGDYQPELNAGSMGEIQPLEELQRLIRGGHLYHVDTSLPLFEVVEKLRGEDL